MDDRRTRFFWSLSLFLAVAVILWEVFSLVGLHNQRIGYEKSMKRELGTDVELDSVINFLEARLEERAVFTFKADENPLDLSRAVYLTDNAAELFQYRQQNTVRVSAVVYGVEPMAVVQFHGENMQLAVGDSVAGERVIDITPEGMATLKSGNRNFYKITAATLSPEDIEKIRQNRRLTNEETN